MELMDEDPPDLVEVSGHNNSSQNDTTAGLEPQLDDLNLSKVPLTIVTGMFLRANQIQANSG